MLFEKEINDIKLTHRQQMTGIESSRDLLVQQAQSFAFSLGPSIVDDFNACHCEALEGEENPQKVLQVKEAFKKKRERLEKLLARPAKYCRDLNGERFYLNSKRHKIYKVDSFTSEYLVDADGNRLKIKRGLPLEINDNGEFYLDSQGREIYSKYYFEDDNGRYYVDIHGDRFYKADPEASEYKLINGQWIKIKDGTYEIDERGRRKSPERSHENGGEEILENVFNFTENKIVKSEDIKYIQTTLGPIIRKALAAVVTHQPADPVNYFANFLLHHHVTQNFYDKREADLKNYLKIREQIKNEKCRQNLNK